MSDNITSDLTLENLNETIKKYITLEQVIPEVTEEFINLRSNLKSVAKELGLTGNASEALYTQMKAVSMMTGLSTKAQLNLLDATKSYHKTLSYDLTKSTLQFTKIAGVEESVIGKLAMTMQTLGETTDEEFQSMYESILSVRDAYGLTNSEATVTIEVLDQYASIIGLTSDNTEEVTSNTAEFISKLSSVGIESSKTKEILNSMIDPTKMTDYVMLWTKMGYTMDDIASGSFGENLDEAIPKLQQVGAEIAETAKTNRIAAANQAAIYNLTLDQALRFAKIDTSEQELNRQKTIEEYKSEISSFKDNIEYFKNQTVGFVATGVNAYNKMLNETFGQGTIGKVVATAISVSTATKLLSTFTVISKKILGSKFVKNLGNIFFGPIGSAWKNTKEKISNGLDEVATRAAKKFSEPIQELLSVSQERLSKKESDKNDIASTNNSVVEKNINQTYSFMSDTWNKQNQVLIKEQNRINKNNQANDEPDVKKIEVTNNYITELENQMRQMLNTTGGKFENLTTLEQQYFNRILETYKTKLKEIGIIISESITESNVFTDKGITNVIKDMLGIQGDSETFDTIFGSLNITNFTKGNGTQNSIISNTEQALKTKRESVEQDNKSLLTQTLDIKSKMEWLSAEDETRKALEKEIESLEEKRKANDIILKQIDDYTKALSTQTIIQKDATIGLMSANDVEKAKAQLQKDADKSTKDENNRTGLQNIAKTVSFAVGGLNTIGAVAHSIYNLADDETKEEIKKIFTDNDGIQAFIKFVPTLIKTLLPVIQLVGNVAGKIAEWAAPLLDKIVSKIGNKVDKISNSSYISSVYTKKMSNNYEDQLKKAQEANSAEMLKVLGKIAFNTGSTSSQITEYATASLPV